MSEEDLLLIRQSYDAMNRRDLPALFQALDPGIEWQPSRQFPEGPFHGFAGVERHFSSLWENFETLHFELEELVEGNDRAYVAIGLLGSRGKYSGASAGYRFGHVWRIRGRKVVRVEIYLDPDEGRAAAGAVD